MKRTVLALIPFLLCMNLFAQELAISESHEEILKNILKMNIMVRILQNEKSPLWDIKQSKLTIPGKAVILKIEGQDIKIYGSFTPYQGKDNLSLLAQTQVILLPPIVSGIRYFNAVKILLITLNEGIFFYPLGRKETSSNPDAWEIEIELQLTPYVPKPEDQIDPEASVKPAE